MNSRRENTSVIVWRDYCAQAQQHERANRIDAAWACLEAAHIVGQRVTRLHTATHALMLGLAWRRRDVREIIGQCSRFLGSMLMTWIWVPVGNTGRANVSALRSAAVPQDLQDRS